jgi:hypothetical protein
MVYNSGGNVLAKNLNYICRSWKLVENMSTCIVNISWHINYNYAMFDSTLYYIPIQTLNVPFALVWFSFLLFFLRLNLCLSLNPCSLSIHIYFKWVIHPAFCMWAISSLILVVQIFIINLFLVIFLITCSSCFLRVLWKEEIPSFHCTLLNFL